MVRRCGGDQNFVIVLNWTEIRELVNTKYRCLPFYRRTICQELYQTKFRVIGKHQEGAHLTKMLSTPETIAIA